MNQTGATQESGTPLTLRIFISSPGDVGQERRIAKRVIERLDAEFGDSAVLDPYFWEYEPFVITGDYQEQIPPPSSFDIFICILWSRLGSRLSAKYTLPPDHQKVADSGTEYEFIDAKLGFEERKSPEIMVWVNKTKVTVDVDDPASEEIRAQRRALNQFIESWTRDDQSKTFTGAINRYATRHEFEEKLEVKLRKLVLKRIGAQEAEIRSRPIWEGNPYRGLSVFEYRHAPVFFGRTTAISQAVDQLGLRLHQVWREQELSAQVAENMAAAGVDPESIEGREHHARAFLLVFGASGSGKSSLSRAGILPMLAESGAIEGVGQWRCAVMKPTDGGGNLMLSLANALITPVESAESLPKDDLALHQGSSALQPAALPELTSDGETAATLATHFSRNPESVADRVVGAIAQVSALQAESDRSHLSAAIERDKNEGRTEDAALTKKRLADYQPRRVCLALVLDQLEELFTRDYSPKQLEAFIRAVDALAASGRVVVIATLRSDFFANCEGREPFQKLLMRLKADDGTLHLSPPRNHELSQMIRLPAQAAGVRFAESTEFGKLEDRIRDAALRDEDSLPLLQFCLEKLYEEGAENGILEHAEYGIDSKRPGIGQLEGVLTQHAEETFEQLKPHQQEALHSVILSMASVGDTKSGKSAPELIRRVVVYDSLTRFGTDGENEEDSESPTRVLVDTFIEARLFTSSRNAEGIRTVSVTHEALLRRWDRVSAWLGLDENQRFLKTRKQIAQKLQLWQENEKDPSFLLQPGRELDAAADQFGEHAEAFEDGETDFIQRSLAKAREDEGRRLRKRNVTIFTLSVLSVVAMMAAGWAFLKQEEARQETTRAVEQEEKANLQVLEAARKAWGASRQAFDEGDPRSGLARLAEAIRYNQSLPIDLKIENLNASAAMFLRTSAPQTPMPVGKPMSHKRGVEIAKFSPDGRKVVTASSDGTAQVWDVYTGKSNAAPMQHDNSVNWAVFSSDGKRVVTTSFDKTARLWDAETGVALTEPMRHDDFVVMAAFNSDGDRIVTASDDKTARLWDAETGKATAPPLLHDAPVSSATFSPDGKRVVTICGGAQSPGDPRAQLWDASTGLTIGKPMLHGGNGLNNAAFSPDGKRLVTTGLDNLARLWDTSTTLPLGTPMKHDDWADNATFSPGGGHVLTTTKYKVMIWDSKTGAPFGKSLPHEDWVNTADYSPDGKRVVTVNEDNSVQVWDFDTRTPVGGPMHHDHYVTSATFSSNGQRIITAGSDNPAWLWRTDLATPISIRLRHDAGVGNAIFSPDGSRVATSDKEGIVRLWDAVTGSQIGEPKKRTANLRMGAFNLGFNSSYYRKPMMVFSPDGSKFVACNSLSTAQIWESDTGTALGEPLKESGAIKAAAFSPDGNRVVTASANTARVWNAQTGVALSAPMEHEDSINVILFSPNGRLVLTASNDNTAQFWDPATGRAIGPAMQHDGPIERAMFSPDSKSIVTVSGAGESVTFGPDGERSVTFSDEDQTGRLWDCETSRVLGDPIRHDGWAIDSLVFSPDGKLILSASNDGTVRLWDSRTAAPLGEPLQHETSVDSVQFNPQGTKIVTTSHDKLARLWDTRSGRMLNQLNGHEGFVVSARFSGDGKQIVTASKDNTSRLWDVETGFAIGEPMRHQDSVNSAMFSSDGKWIVTASADKTACLWNIETGIIDAPDPLALEIYGGYRVNSSGFVVRIPTSERKELCDSILTSVEESSAWGRLLKWRFTNSLDKTITPYSKVTVRKVIEQEMDWVADHSSHESNPSIIDSIYNVYPGHPLMPFLLALVEPDKDRRKFLVNLGNARIAQDPVAGDTPTAFRVRNAAIAKVSEN